MKKRNIVISAVILVLLLVGLGVGLFLVGQQQDLRKKAAPATTFSILPSVKTVNVGDDVTLTIQMNTSTNTVTGAELHLTYDPSKLTLKDFTPLSELLPVVFVSPQIDNTKGTASMSLSAQPANPPQGQGGLATLKFSAKSAGTATIAFTPQTLATGIGEGTNVLASQNSATLTIIEPGVNATPTQSAAVAAQAATPTPLPKGIGGVTTPTPTIKISTPTPTQVGTKTFPIATTSAGTPVVGVSLPIVLSLIAGLFLLIAGVVLAL